MNAGSKPQFVAHYQRECFSIFNGIYIANDNELLLMSDKYANIFPEQRKRRIRDHDVCLIQKLQTFRGTEITIPFQFRQLIFS